MNLYLIEYYTQGGMDIRFVWVKAESSQNARTTLDKFAPDRGDVIQVGQHSHIEKLHLCDQAQPPLIRQCECGKLAMGSYSTCSDCHDRALDNAEHVQGVQ